MFTWAKISTRQLQINSDYLIQIKRYGRWTHRRPSRILPPEEYENKSEVIIGNQDETVKEHTSTNTIKWKHIPSNQGMKDNVRPKIKPIIKKNVTNQATCDMLQTTIDSNGELIYTKLPNKDAKVVSLLTSVQSNTAKDKKSILLEGKRLIKEALENNCKLEYLLFSRKTDIDQLKSLLPKSGAILYKMPYREIQLWSGLTTSPGIMGIFKKPDLENLVQSTYSIPLTVICDNIREPGNLGSILRTCAGAGCQKIILTKGCVNLWDTKVTRGASGAHFRLQISTKTDWCQIEEEIPASNMIFMADNKLLSSSNEHLEDITFKIENIPLVPYYGIHIDKSESFTLIIGGETEGLSEDAYKFVYDRKGVRLNIPLMSGIDSLNSGVAFGIILFEMKKQMLLNVRERETIIQNIG